MCKTPAHQGLRPLTSFLRLRMSGGFPCYQPCTKSTLKGRCLHSHPPHMLFRLGDTRSFRRGTKSPFCASPWGSTEGVLRTPSVRNPRQEPRFLVSSWVLVQGPLTSLRLLDSFPPRKIKTNPKLKVSWAMRPNKYKAWPAAGKKRSSGAMPLAVPVVFGDHPSHVRSRGAPGLYHCSQAS